jgi:2-aminoethylphosphonate-pyruvate transaminase
MITTAVILAAGMGSRIKDKFDDRPKGFINIGGQSIIERSLDILESNGITRILIGTGHLSKHYEDLAHTRSITCIKNTLFDSSGSFYTLYNMQDILVNDFILLESDLVYESKAVSNITTHTQQDVILASGKTNSGDEVFIETDANHYLRTLSKDVGKVSNIYGELVGISKISIKTYQKLCTWAQNHSEIARQIHYEEAIAINCKETPIYIERVKDLVWSEIDTAQQFEVARDTIFPKIVSKEQ